MGIVSQFGQITGSSGSPGSDTRALYLKVYAGELITQFAERNVMRELITTRTIATGKSLQFPVLGKGSAVVHTIGDNLLTASGTLYTAEAPTTSVSQYPKVMAQNERLLFIDNKIISDVNVPDIDEMLTHFAGRGAYVTEQVRQLNNTFDRTAILALIGAARVRNNAADLVYGEPGGGTNGDGGGIGVATATAGTGVTGGAITDALWACAQRFDELDIPKEGRAVLIPWASFYKLIKDPTLYSIVATTTSTTSTFARAVGSGNFPASVGGGAGFSNPNLQFGNADWARGTIQSVAGFAIIPTNHIPQADYSGTTFYSQLAGSNGNSYAYNCGTSRTTAGMTQGVAFHSSALGCLMKQDVTLESEYKIEYQFTMLVAKMLSGFRYLRPSSAIELTSVTTTSGAN